MGEARDGDIMKPDRTGLPKINCAVTVTKGVPTIIIAVNDVADVDTAVALTKKLAFPIASALTEFYRVEPPKPDEFDMSPQVAGSIH